MATLLPPANATGTCDRRMSRAARQLLMEQLVPLLDHWLHLTSRHEGIAKDKGQQVPRSVSRWASSSASRHAEATLKGPQTSLASPPYLWETLRLAASPECPLFRDVYRNFEEQSYMVRPRAPKLAPRRNYPHWYSCGMCGKAFSSRYYLDRHQHLRHNNDTATNSVKNVCLGHVVCDALGGCDQVALDLEPYYGRGSGFAELPDGTAVRRAWAAQIQPCHETHVQTILKPNCRKLMEDCFHHDDDNRQNDATQTSLSRMLIDTLCEPLSCHALLHRQELMHRHWIRSSGWHPVHPSWTTVGLVVGLLAMFYFAYFTWMAERGSHGGKAVGGRTLLQKKKRSPSLTWFTRRMKKKLH